MATSKPVTLVWKASELLWREWEGENVVFNLNSGNTHLLNSAAVDVLRLLEKETLSAEEISERLISMVGGSSDEEIVKNVETLLMNLDHLGLVEPVPQ